MSQPKPQPRWVRKPAAAEFLGVSERQVERHASAGRLRWRRLPRKGHETQSPVEFRFSDLQAIREGKPRYFPKLQTDPVPPLGLAAVASESIPPVVATSDLDHAVQAAVPSAVEILLRALLERVPALAALPAAPVAPTTAEDDGVDDEWAPKAEPAPWLRAEEGAALLGLPVRKIRELMASGEVAVVDVGIAKPRLRVSRDDLLAWRPKASASSAGS